jgi:hypothetical protein
VAGDLYRVVDLPPNSHLTPTCRPQGPAHLSNGATIQGYYTPHEPWPRPGQPWTIYILWAGDHQDAAQLYQMFNHLVDEAGDIALSIAMSPP